ncbi:hypothetical protein GCM10011529_09540 [Polymorphobacter glacialis]|uniref:SMODS and SLOG-associating 2TM effector domain-containing protein n=1 Tax=Sandarakinorhabdus glacialis TaxID=1614636 RepID=A0A917E540_9SPHN|nr:hypothetical protein GCM10011529_09540 [Polymorphobacter glacialis]
MHRCALDINELRREGNALLLEQADKDAPDFVRRYSSVLQKWSINHSESDFLKYKYEHRWEFEDLRDLSDVGLWTQKARLAVNKFGWGGLSNAAAVGGLLGAILSLFSLVLQ